ncbi:phospholipid phosphatase-related protein type 4 isoform X2 [Dunckerocampus dactyliophorus]|uniref:phospholipid phosphatase-related protein type 4 isoform X2 n=1 Tax=Dunckerocampus dactyliophorus TaxID=161453 RepID=UPI00240685D5|nr:phospholipid phosphatase-related protein type 4 isoform X2 [Dunckerocampus dactyliophorus]
MSARERALMSKDSVSLLPCFYFVELPILVSSMVSLYFLEWTDLFKPVKSGFHCHDRSLSLPYIDPNHEVIPLLMLLSLAFAGPAITMQIFARPHSGRQDGWGGKTRPWQSPDAFGPHGKYKIKSCTVHLHHAWINAFVLKIMIGEAILFCCLSRRKSCAGAEANINAAGCNFNSFIRRAIRFVALVTDILQLMTGYPAPYFLTVCKPNYTTLSMSCEHNSYVMEDICSGLDSAAINRGRKSFPSQHATLASFAAVYVSMYFNSTLTDSSKLLKPLLVFSFIICAIICGLTRIIQYKNHAIDVYLGFLIGGAIALYLGLYAVGNFLPSEESSTSSPSQPHCPSCSFPHISQEAVLHHHLQMKASLSGEARISSSQSEGLLHRALPQQNAEESLKCPTRDADGIPSHSPRSKDTVATFSHTLPRVHTPQAIAAYEEAARRHAATLNHASMDSSRSKQLLSQWKSKNSHKSTLQVPDCFLPSGDLSSVPPAQHPHYHGSMEVRSSSEPSAVSLDASFEAHAFMSKLATGASSTLPSNCSGITGGARMLMQPRPGSSQLVHIPEESHENYHNTSPRAVGGGSEGGSAGESTVQANWQRAAEKTTQPRIVQVIAMSKQQGLLQTHSRSLDESSTVGSSQGSAHYRALTDKEPSSTTGPSSLASATGSISGSTGAIVRIEAHPENHKPVIQAPSTDGSGSWRWRSLDHGNGAAAVGPAATGSGILRQSFDLNDLNRDSESSDSIREGSIDRKRSNHVVTSAGTVSTPPVVAVQTSQAGIAEQKHHNQSLSTIRVTPGDGGGSGDTAPEILSATSSRESTLRRKGHNVILIPERGSSPDITRNVFYKGTSMPNKE